MPVITLNNKGRQSQENIIGFFEKMGYKILSYDPNTTNILAEKDKKKESFNLANMVAKLGGKLLQADSLNSPEDALEETPASFMDRLKLSFSGQKERPSVAKKLKSTFTDAQMTKDGTLVVKENGIWKRVDPSGLDPGDFADMVGYLLPVIGQGLGATGGAIGGGILGAPGGPAGIGLGGFAGEVVGGATGAGLGEALRQNVGKLLGVKGPGLDTGEFREQTIAGALAKPVGMGLAFGGKTAMKTIPSILSFTTGIPKKIVEFAMKHPEVISGQAEEIKLPSGKIYNISKSAAKKLLKLKEYLGKGIREAAENIEGALSIKEIKRELLQAYRNTIKNVWGGVNQLTPGEQSIFKQALSNLKVSKPGQEPIEASFLKLHNLKQFLTDRVDWGEGDTKGGIFLKGLAEHLKTKLEDVANKMGSDYPQLNQQYSALVAKLKGFGSDVPSIAKKINTFLTKAYRGTITEPEKAVMQPVEKTIGKNLLGVATQSGETAKVMNEMLRASRGAFESWNPHWAPLILSTILSGGRAITEGPGAVVGAGLGTASALLPLTIPKVVGTGIQLGANISRAIPGELKALLGSPMAKNLLGLGAVKLGQGGLEGNY